MSSRSVSVHSPSALSNIGQYLGRKEGKSEEAVNFETEMRKNIDETTIKFFKFNIAKQ